MSKVFLSGRQGALLSFGKTELRKVVNARPTAGKTKRVLQGAPYVPPPPVTPTGPAVTANKVVALGDSIGAGIFNALITARSDLSVTNLCIPGASLNAGLSIDLDGPQQLETLLAMSARPAVVVIECGANDLLGWYDSHGQNGASFMAERKRLLIDPIKAWSPNTKIVVATVLGRADHPQGNYVNYDAGALAAMNAARAADRAAIFAAKAAGQIDYVVDYATDIPLGADNAPISGVMLDGVHPTSTYTPRLVDLYSGAIDVALTGQPDTKPLDFSFPSKDNVATNSDILSDPITIEHLGPGQTAAISGRYTKNSSNPANITTANGTVQHGDVIRAAVHTFGPATNASQGVTIGGVTRVFATATAGAVPVQVTASTEGVVAVNYGTQYPATINVVQTLPAGYLLFALADSTQGGQKPDSIQVFAPSDTNKTNPITANLLDGTARTGGLVESIAIYGCVGPESGAYTFRCTVKVGAWHDTGCLAVSAQHATGVDAVVGWEGNYAGGGDPRLSPVAVTPAPNGAWVAMVAGEGAFVATGTDVAPAAGSKGDSTVSTGVLAGWGYSAGKPAWASTVAYWGGVGAIITLHP